MVVPDLEVLSVLGADGVRVVFVGRLWTDGNDVRFVVGD